MSRSEQVPGRLSMALPYVPVLAVGVTGAMVDLADRPLGRFLYIDGALLLGLIMGRQLLSLFANVTLSGRLQETVTALQESERQLAHRAYHDDLTGLPNRAMFHERLVEQLRSPGGVMVLLIDLDDFKAVNDTHGHHVGDALLVDVARRLQASVSSRDIVARLGGDEFAILLCDQPSARVADRVVHRISDSLREPLRLPDATVEIRASIGISAGSERQQDLDGLLRAADAAMYRAKAQRKQAHSPAGDEARLAQR
jgi:diguanylate cyclase (GGDEF)-like protein